MSKTKNTTPQPEPIQEETQLNSYLVIDQHSGLEGTVNAESVEAAKSTFYTENEIEPPVVDETPEEIQTETENTQETDFIDETPELQTLEIA